jgi:hypothetical protein
VGLGLCEAGAEPSGKEAFNNRNFTPMFIEYSIPPVNETREVNAEYNTF